MAARARLARRRRRRRSASSRPTAAPRPRRCSPGFEVIPRQQRRLQGPRARGDGPRRASSRAGRSSCWSTSSPTPTRRAAAIPSATSTSRSCWRAGIDVYTTLNIQHVESLNDVVAQITRVRVRETVPDFDHRPRRRHRAHRPHARRPDPAAEGGQGLCARDGRARARALFLARQPDGAARAGAAPHRRSASTTRCSPTCRRTPSPGPGRRASGCWSASSEDPRAARRWCATPSAWPTGCARPGRRSISRRRAALQLDRGRARPARRDPAPRRAARRRGDHHARPRPASPTRSSRYARRTTSPRSSSASPTRSRWFELLHGSVVHDLVRRAGDISVHVIAGDERGRPAPTRRADRAHGRAVRAAALSRSALLFVAIGARRRQSARAGISTSRNVALVFLTAVLSSAARYGLWPSLCRRRRQRRCAFNFFFLPPLYTLHHRRSRQRRRAVLLSCSSRSIASNLTGARPRQAVAARRRARSDRGRSTPSAASSPASARSTTCSGRPPSRSPRC